MDRNLEDEDLANWRWTESDEDEDLANWRWTGVSAGSVKRDFARDGPAPV